MTPVPPQQILDDWKAWTGEHLITSNPILHVEFFGGDTSVIRFTYNNGVGLPAPGYIEHTYEGILFYEGPTSFIGRLLGRSSPGSFRGWGRLMQARPTGSLLTASITATSTSLPVLDRGQFPSTPDFWVVVQDHQWDTTNAEAMFVTGGTGQGAGDFTVNRPMLGTSAVAHHGHPTNGPQMSWVGLRGQTGNDTMADTPRVIYDTPADAQWVYLEIPADASARANFTFYSDYRGSVLSEKQELPTEGEVWGDPQTGELKFESPWWVTYRKTTAG